MFKMTPIEALSKNKVNHINELLHFEWTILRRRYSLFLISFIDALDVNYYGID